MSGENEQPPGGGPCEKHFTPAAAVLANGAEAVKTEEKCPEFLIVRTAPQG